MKIKSFPFHNTTINDAYASNWPVVYIINNDKEAYIGETTNIQRRLKEHQADKERNKLKHIHMIADDTFNMSVTKSYESTLIQYMCDEYILQNGNDGLINHHYYQKAEYDEKFIELWSALFDKKIVQKHLEQIRNSDIFKYSPYKALSQDQYDTAMDIIALIKKQDHNFILVSGEPGTGKTILAIYLCKYLATLGKKENRSIKFALVIPMEPLRETLRKVFKQVFELSPDQVIGPSDVIKNDYDILIVDEGHKLKQRKNIPNYGSFDSTAQHLGLDPKETDQLDWIRRSSKHQIIFYEAKQKIGPSGISLNRFTFHGIEENYTSWFSLQSQFRVLGGQDYIRYVYNILTNQVEMKRSFDSYEFKLFTSYKTFIDACNTKEKNEGLTRVVAGFAWPWASKNDKSKIDIVIDGVGRQWNVKTKGWVHTKNSTKEIGSIHTIQGYDLNYAGVIIGKDLRYDKNLCQVVVDSSHYYDKNGKKTTEPSDLFTYITNIYYVLMTRGIQGTYVYVCDEDLREYLAQYIEVVDAI